MNLEFRYYLLIGIALGVVSALGDGLQHLQNVVPYLTGGTGLLGGLSYVLMLILGKWVE